MPAAAAARTLVLVLALTSPAWAFDAPPAHARLDGPPKKEIERRAATVGERALRVALRAVGTPYRWGGASPANGFDCSGLVYWSYGRLGIAVPHSSYALYGLGRHIPTSRLRKGDLLFFSGLGHVGIYAGRGRMVHAPQSGRHVEVVSLHGPYYGRLVGARRIVD